MAANEASVERVSRVEAVGSFALGGFVTVVVTLIIAWFLFGAVYGVGIGTPAPTSAATPTAATNTSQPSVNAVTVYQTISFSPWQGHDQYYPANFTVPVNVPVTFIISSYDNGTNYLPLGAQMVTGTNNGKELVKGGQPGTPQGEVDTFPANDTAHTFSMKSVSPAINLNVIVPPTANISYPVQVSFVFTFTATGSYTWFCQAPCDPYSMSTPGYMSGTVSVVPDY